MPGWQHQLDAACTEAEVVALANRFLESLAARDVARLPGECRPRIMRQADDITHYAFVLVRHHGRDDDETGRLIYRIARFFSSAAIRVSQVMARPRDADQDRESA